MVYPQGRPTSKFLSLFTTPGHLFYDWRNIMPVTKEQKTEQLEKISEYKKQRNYEDAISCALDILTNDALDDWNPEQIIELNDKLKNRKQKLNNSDYPEYEAIRALLSSLTDRESVLVSLIYSLMTADNYGNDAGRYLNNLFQECIKRSRQKSHSLIEQDNELKTLALLAEIIEGLSY